jgi:hypothetical protein
MFSTHSRGTDMAMAAFAEAINQQGGPTDLAKTNPIEFNKLTGLHNLAYAVHQLEKQIAQLTKEVQKLKSK